MDRFYQVIIRTVFFLTALILLQVSGRAQGSDNATAAGAAGQTPESYRKSVETFAKLDQSNNFTESLNYVDMNVLPMGIKQTLSNIEVTIAVSDMRWETTHSELTVFARIKIPQESKTLFFGAQGIKLSNNGDIVGDASLVLLGDVSIPINGNTAALTLKGNFDINSGRGKELTYVSIDCKGFKEMGITAEVEFAESMLQLVDEKGKVKPGRVKAGFQTVITDWNDVLASISLPRFQVVGLDGFVFTLSQAVFDFSDLRNDPAIVYPEGYEAAYMIPGNAALWRGVYVRDLVITLPPQFVRRDKNPVSFEAHNMLIDNNGISGLFAATGLLPMEQGSASGWRFSVESFSIALEANQLTAAGFSGQIGLPVSEKSNLAYDAIISADNEYLLRVKPMGKFNFDVFHAKAELLPNSYVALEVADGKFKPEAMLHGSLNFSPKPSATEADTTGKSVAQFKGIEFRSLHLKTEAPRFTAEYFGYKGELKMMNFPISIDRIGLRVLENEVALGLDIKLTLSDAMFTGSTRLEVVGALKETGGDGEGGGSQRWVYDKVNVSMISVNAKIAETFSLSAQLTILNDDPIYGDGYAGSLDMRFDKVLKGMEIKARAMFGRKDFRYWFVDGRVKFGGTGITVFPPLNINGFGGGVSYRMKRDGADLLASPTGCKYVPDANTGIGVKASVLFNVTNETVINGEASFEIAFSNSGGVNFIGFYGYAKFVGKIPGTENIEKFVGDKMKKVADLEKKFIDNNPALKKTLQNLKQFEPNKAAAAVFEPSEKPGQAGFSAAVGIQYDFTQSSFHATFDLYVNAIGGVIRGTASGNRAGWAVFHIDPKEWYMHMGTPTDRLGLKMGIGGISVETGSYLMLGSRIPGSPPPPREVADILGVDMQELDYMRDLNALGQGKGFAFGASLKIATGDLTFLVLYANFQCGLGFDIMLKDYGDMQCKGRSGAIGIDGWFANGQSYVYLQGELGIKVNLWFLKTKIPIIQGAAAALMQAKLPNPTFVKGYLGVKFNLLGGLVKGSCRFKVTLGEECELVVLGSSPIDMRMIADLTPKTNSTAVDVFAAPQAAFNMRVGVPFDVEDDQGPKTFRIQLNEFSVSDNGQPIKGKLVWSDNKDGVSFYSHEVLPPTRALHAVVTVGFEQYTNGKWVVVYTSGQKAQESMDVNFTTGTAPDVIPMQNVEYAYPVVAQKFFLKGESPAGIIQLKRGQSYLFSDNYRNEIHVTRADGTFSAVPFTYSATSNRIDYTMPDLSAGSGYTTDIVLMSKNGSDASLAPTVTSTDTRSGDDVVSVSNAQAGNVVRADLGKSLLQYTFATSRYNTFAEKMAANAPRASSWQKVSSTIINLLYKLNVAEPFDPIDLRGSEHTGGHPLVAGIAALNDPFFLQTMNPVLYSKYPVAGLTFTARDPKVYGVPPAHAVYVMTSYLTEVENGLYTNYAGEYLPFVYALPEMYQRDFADMQNQLVNKFVDSPVLGQYSSIVNSACPAFPVGSYRIQLQYTLPDGTKGTAVDFDYVNTLK